VGRTFNRTSSTLDESLRRTIVYLLIGFLFEDVLDMPLENRLEVGFGEPFASPNSKISASDLLDAVDGLRFGRRKDP